MKRLGKTAGPVRDREWEDLLSESKRSRYDTDGDAIMVSIKSEEEYAEILDPAAIKPEAELADQVVCVPVVEPEIKMDLDPTQPAVDNEHASSGGNNVHGGMALG